MKFIAYVARFFSVFLALYIAFHLFDFHILKQLVAEGSVIALGALGTQASLQGLTIASGNIRFNVISSCTGAVSFSIFAALLQATERLKPKRKARYALLSIPVFLAWNVLRVSSSIYAGGETMFLLHDALWVLSSLLIMALYVYVLRRERIRLSFRKVSARSASF